MDDLISRQAAIDALSTPHGILYPIRTIEELPATQPERKKGKWIQFPKHMAYKCSECGRVIQTTDGQKNVPKHYPFCHCGADMRKEEMSE